MFARTGAPKPIDESWRLFFFWVKCKRKNTLDEDQEETPDSILQRGNASTSQI
jgi:hypothetical protein